MPFQPSPGKDDGYDISDYYGVDPRYGTLGDFVEFTHSCHQRGIRVIIDLVVNHTSDQHAWFRDARGAGEFCAIATGMCGRTRSRPMPTRVGFPGVRKSAGRADTTSSPVLPTGSMTSSRTLNTSNPYVRAEILKIMGFWLQLGVSGFRMDAVPFVIATKGPKVNKPTEQYDMLRAFRANSCNGARATPSFSPKPSAAGNRHGIFPAATATACR